MPKQAQNSVLQRSVTAMQASATAFVCVYMHCSSYRSYPKSTIHCNTTRTHYYVLGEDSL
jgi:hypothetical protein